MQITNMRTAYGEALVALGRENKNIVVLEADLGKSTMSCLFEKEYPDRFFEIGIAEANMLSVAAGLAQTGKIPFVHSFAVFSAGRAFDQIRQTISIGKLGVKICGSSAGLSDFGDGATHQSIEDIAIMRAIPNMTVLCPADANEAARMVRAMAEHLGPCYFRLNRNPYDNITSEDVPFTIGEPSVLREGTDVAVFACGIMVKHALEAAELLKGELSVKVVNVHTLKPLDSGVIMALAKGCRGIVTAEEHSVIGGLGSAIAQAMARKRIPIAFVAIDDEFGTSAHNYTDLLKKYHLMPEDIALAARDVVS